MKTQITNEIELKAGKDLLKGYKKTLKDLNKAVVKEDRVSQNRHKATVKNMVIRISELERNIANYEN